MHGEKNKICYSKLFETKLSELASLFSSYVKFASHYP